MDIAAIATFLTGPIGLILLTPVIGTAITLIFERAGISGRLREQDFYHKRVELIGKILETYNHLDPAKEEQDTFNSLKRELKSIISYLEDTSSEVIDNRNIFERFFAMKTDSTLAMFLTVIFYGYLSGFVGFSAILVFYPNYGLFDTSFKKIFMPASLLCLTLYVRYYAYKSYQRRRRTTSSPLKLD